MKIILYYCISEKKKKKKDKLMVTLFQQAEKKVGVFCFLSFDHTFDQFYFQKDTISKSLHLSECFGRIITFWQEKNSLWPAVWVIFAPVMSIILAVVFTLSCHLLSILSLFSLSIPYWEDLCFESLGWWIFSEHQKWKTFS